MSIEQNDKNSKKKIAIINQDGKVFGKLNIIDLFVVLLILLVTLGTIYKFKSRVAIISGGEKKISYQVVVKDIKSSSAKFYKKGLKVLDSKTNTDLGVIKNVHAEDYSDFITDINGIIHKSKKPDKIQVFLDIDANGIETEQAYLVGGTYELKAGADIYIATKYADVIGTINKVN